ncbi:kinase-like domain-containing protein, partial [Pilaira anomala]
VNKLEYRIIMPIGEGGSGKVFLALSLKYTDIFALKWVSIRDDQDKQNVKNEIELMHALRKSPYIINLCDSEITPRVACMILEYGSTTFAELIEAQTRQKWDITFFKYYWKQMLNAVSVTHDHCIVHADLKPANFVVVKGRLKLIDFGIADRIPDNTARIGRENQVGTANFMAPEALMGLGTRFGTQYKQGRPSDVWSLGCILYQMIFSKPPFGHIPAAGRINAITDPKHAILFPLNVKYGNETIQIPDELRRLLKLCLNRDPDRRPTVDELLGDSFTNI